MRSHFLLKCFFCASPFGPQPELRASIGLAMQSFTLHVHTSISASGEIPINGLVALRVQCVVALTVGGDNGAGGPPLPPPPALALNDMAATEAAAFDDTNVSDTEVYDEDHDVSDAYAEVHDSDDDVIFDDDCDEDDDAASSESGPVFGDCCDHYMVPSDSGDEEPDGFSDYDSDEVRELIEWMEQPHYLNWMPFSGSGGGGASGGGAGLGEPEAEPEPTPGSQSVVTSSSSASCSTWTRRHSRSRTPPAAPPRIHRRGVRD